jgi:UDPglucose 6-dehydrogenase
MKIGVVGLWHLGVVLSAGLSKIGYDIVAFDSDSKIINKLESGHIPVDEPGVIELIKKFSQSKKITFTSNPKDLSVCEVIWVAYDTPVDDFDKGNYGEIINEFKQISPWISPEANIVISSQLPVGSAKVIRNIIDLQILNNRIKIAVSPENLRLGKAMDSLLKAERIIVGIEDLQPNQVQNDLFNSFNSKIIWMKIESAEMLKHALNSFLATSITFMCEISEICEKVGADANEVSLGLKSDSRIGDKSYLSPGLGFAGGTLARDVNYLKDRITRRSDKSVISSLLESNTYNNKWVIRKIYERYSYIQNFSIIFIGLTYTTGTNTLRRSSTVEMALDLAKDGARIYFHEEEEVTLPKEYAQTFNRLTEFVDNPNGTSILIITKKLSLLQDTHQFANILSGINLIIDPYGYLRESKDYRSFSDKYLSVGFNDEL